MLNTRSFAQAFLRLALAIGFVSPVLDRFGLWGPPGSPNVGWGDWKHFSDYAHSLMFFLPSAVAEFLAVVATLAEVVLALLLIIGFKTRWAAIGSALLTFSFAVCMTLALGIQAPLNYSVLTVCAGSLLLATLPEYPWSMDARHALPPATAASPASALGYNEQV